jgi:predicted nucleic acid-binding protein
MLVLDSSVALAWALDDEMSLGPETLGQLTAVDVAAVPAHWILEVTNALRMAVRRRRLDPGDPAQVLARIRNQPVEVDAETFTRGWHEIPLLADRYGLTTYDAAYLELAMRLDAPLATLDQDLARAARKAGVTLFA